MHKIVLIILMFLCISKSIAQSNPQSLMLYFKDETIFMPIFLSSFHDLEYNKNDKFFQEIQSLNNIYSNSKYEIVLREAMSYYTNKNMTPPDSIVIFENKIAAQLTNYSHLAIIDINIINNYIEVQLNIYLPYKKGDTYFGIFPSTDISSPTYSSSFIIDLSKNNHNSIINREVRKIFPNLNVKPMPSLRVGARNIDIDTVIYAKLGDTLTLDGSSSSDPDTDQRLLSYFWSLSKTNRYGLYEKNSIFLNNRDDKFKISSVIEDTVCIGFWIYDGISYSDTINTKIIFIKKPYILINNNKNKFLINQFKNKKITSHFLLLVSPKPWDDKNEIINLTERNKNPTFEELKNETLDSLSSEKFKYKKSTFNTYKKNKGYYFTIVTHKKHRDIDTFDLSLSRYGIESNRLTIINNYYTSPRFLIGFGVSSGLIFSFKTNTVLDSINTIINSSTSMHFNAEIKLFDNFYLGSTFGGSTALLESKDDFFEIWTSGSIYLYKSIAINSRRSDIFRQINLPLFYISPTISGTRYEISQNNLVNTSSYFSDNHYLFNLELKLSINFLKSRKLWFDLNIVSPSLNRFNSDRFLLKKRGINLLAGVRLSIK